MKKTLSALLLVLALVLWAPPPAFAGDISIASQTIPYWPYDTTGTVYLEITLEQGVVVWNGVPMQPGWTRRIPVTLQTTTDGVTGEVSTSATIPGITLPSTTDGQDTKAARYTARFVDDYGNVLGPYYGFESFRLQTAYPTSPATWAQIRTAMAAPVPYTPGTTYTTEQIDTRISQAIAGASGVHTLNMLTGPDITLQGSANIQFATGGSTITASLVGPVGVTLGGTGLATATTNGVVYGQGASALGVTAAGPASSVLTGTGGAPAFSTSPTLLSLGLGVASSSTGTAVFRNASNANTVTLQPGATSSSYTWTLPLAQGPANALLTQNGSGVLSWTTTPALGATTVSALTVQGLTATRIPYAATGGLLADDSAFLWDATNNRLAVDTTEQTYAFNTGNSRYYAGHGNVSGGQVRIAGIETRQQVVSMVGTGTSIVDTTADVDAVELAPGGTPIAHVYTEAGATAISPFRPLYENGNTGIHVHVGLAGAYNDSSRTGDWHFASIVTAKGTTPLVAGYFENVGVGAGAQPFALNTSTIARANNMHLTGYEAGITAIDDGVTPLTGVGGTGIYLKANSSGIGTYTFSRAVYIGSQGTGLARWNNGLEFDSNDSIVTAMIAGGVNTPVVGIDFAGVVPSSGQAIKIANNTGLYSNNAAGTSALNIAALASTNYFVFGDASASASINGTLIYSGAGTESIRVLNTTRVGINAPASLTHQLQIRPTRSRSLTGTVATNAGSPTVSGTGTAFTTELRPGNTVRINAANYTVLNVTSDTSLTLATNAASTLTGQTATSDDPSLRIETENGANTILDVDERGTLILYDDGATGISGSTPHYTDLLGALQIRDRLDGNNRLIFGFDHDTLSAYVGARTVGGVWRNFIVNAGSQSGFVGIGTAVPIALLTVEGSGAKTTSFIATAFNNTATNAGVGYTDTKIGANYTLLGSWNGSVIGLRSDVRGGVDASGNKRNYPLTLHGGEVLIAPQLDESPIFSPLAMLDVYGTTTRAIAGTSADAITVSVTNGSAVVNGTGTAFLTTLRPGYSVRFNSDAAAYQVASVSSDTVFTLTATYGGTTATLAQAWTDPPLFRLVGAAGTTRFKVDPDGRATFTGDVVYSNATATVAAAGTISIAGLQGRQITLTGAATTISTINGGVDGQEIVLITNAAHTFDEAGNLVVPGASITTTATSLVTFVYNAGLGKWLCRSYMPN